MNNKNLQDLLEKKSALLEKKSAALDAAMSKLAEISNDATQLAGAATDLKNENIKLSEEVAEKTEKITEMATDPSTTGSVEEDTKLLLVDTVGQLDPDLADKLEEEIDQAEETEDGLTGEKLANVVVAVLSSYVKKATSQINYGTSKPIQNRNFKSAGTTNSWAKAAEATLDNILNI